MFKFCVNLSLFFGSKLLATSAISLSKQAARCDCLSAGCPRMICCLNCKYTCNKHPANSRGGRSDLFQCLHGSRSYIAKVYQLPEQRCWSLTVDERPGSALSAVALPAAVPLMSLDEPTECPNTTVLGSYIKHIRDRQLLIRRVAMTDNPMDVPNKSVVCVPSMHSMHHPQRRFSPKAVAFSPSFFLYFFHTVACDTAAAPLRLSVQSLPELSTGWRCP